MNPTDQRLAIAETMGISICNRCFHVIDPIVCHCGDSMVTSAHEGHWPIPMGCTCGYDDAAMRRAEEPECPNYLSDLNACYEMERSLDLEEHEEYVYQLSECCAPITGEVWECVHASARARCEAFLRTIGKWKE